MSDVTTYLVTNQITPTPLPHHCAAVAGGGGTSRCNAPSAAVCVSNFLFDCHSCLPLGPPLGPYATTSLGHLPHAFHRYGCSDMKQNQTLGDLMFVLVNKLYTI